MAVTLTDFAPYALTNNGTSPLATKVTFPGGTVAVWVHSLVDGTQLSSAGTDGVDIGANMMAVPEGMLVLFDLPDAVFGNPPSIYVAHDDASGVTLLWPVFSRVA